MRTVSFDLPVDHVDKVGNSSELQAQSSDSLLATIQEIHATDRFYLSELDTILLYEPDLATKDAIEVIKTAHAQLVTLTLGELHKWPTSLCAAYKKYLSCYNYKADDSERYAYLRKRPFTRLGYLSKMMRRVEQGLNKEIGSSLLLELASEARTLIQTQMDQVDSNTFYFSKVVSFDTFEPVGASFDTQSILFRDILQFQLMLPSGNWSNKITVEIMLLNNRSLAICSLESPGRALMFPTFRHGDLLLQTDEVAPLNFTSKTKKQPNYHTINLRSCHISPTKSLRLRSTNQKLVLDWETRLRELFGQAADSYAQLNTHSKKPVVSQPDALGIRVPKQYASFKRLSLGLGGSISDFSKLAELFNSEDGELLTTTTSSSSISKIAGNSRITRDLSLASISEIATPDLSSNSASKLKKGNFSSRTDKDKDSTVNSKHVVTKSQQQQRHQHLQHQQQNQQQQQMLSHASDSSKSSIEDHMDDSRGSSRDSSNTSLSSIASADNSRASMGYKLKFDPSSSLYLYNTSNADFNSKLSHGSSTRRVPSEFPPLPGTPPTTFIPATTADAEESTETLCAPTKPLTKLKVPRVPVGSAGNSPLSSPILSEAPKLPPPPPPPPVTSSESYDEIKPLLAPSLSVDQRLASEESMEVLRARELRQSISEIDNESVTETQSESESDSGRESGPELESASYAEAETADEGATNVDAGVVTSTPTKARESVFVAPQVEPETAELAEAVSNDVSDYTAMDDSFAMSNAADSTANTTVSSVGRSLSATPKKYAKKFKGSFLSLVRRKRDQDSKTFEILEPVTPDTPVTPEDAPATTESTEGQDGTQKTESITNTDIEEPKNSVAAQSISTETEIAEPSSSSDSVSTTDAAINKSSAPDQAAVSDNSTVVTLFRGLCTPKKWKGPHWIPISEGELAVQVCVTGQGGVLYAGNKAKLNLLPSHEIRKSTAHDVQITQGSKATMFRFKSQDSAGRFYEALQMSRVDVRQQPLLYYPGGDISSNPPSLNSTDSSLGSLSSLELPPSKALLSNSSPKSRISMKRYGSSGTVSTIFEEEEEDDEQTTPSVCSSMSTTPTTDAFSPLPKDTHPTLLLLNNLRCKLHGLNIQGQWTTGELARLSVFSVSDSTSKSILIRPLHSNEPLLYETNIESKCFSRVGRVGISVALDDNPPRWMLQFKGEKEVAHVHELFQNE